jgi:hypothetical protein
MQVAVALHRPPGLYAPPASYSAAGGNRPAAVAASWERLRTPSLA